MMKGVIWTKRSSLLERNSLLGCKIIFAGADILDRAGGVKINPETGNMEQMDDQTGDSTRVTIFSNNPREKFPIVLIVGWYYHILSPAVKELNFIQALKMRIVPHESRTATMYWALFK